MKLNLNFLGGAGVQNKRPSAGGVWIFFWNCTIDASSQSANVNIYSNNLKLNLRNR